jgi:hypothetical protein
MRADHIARSGKQAAQQSGKCCVNEDDEENLASGPTPVPQ